MDTSMKTTFMSDQDMSRIQSILDEHGLSGFDASIRLWGRGKAIEVKGTLGRQELSCLLAIASFLDGRDDEMPGRTSQPGAMRSPADETLSIPTVLVDVPTSRLAAAA